MTAADNLDVGLDAGLETYPRVQLAVLAATPWLVQVDTPLGIAIAIAWISWAGGLPIAADWFRPVGAAPGGQVARRDDPPAGHW